tara:strand:- start:44 stop:811 length:768 start_codon:yes stop_codon:yes gene_type:complete
MKYNTKKYNKKSSKKYKKKSSKKYNKKYTKKYTKKSSKKYTKKFSKKFSKKGGTDSYPESTNADNMITFAEILNKREYNERNRNWQEALKAEAARQDQARKAKLTPIIEELNRKHNNRKEIAERKLEEFRRMEAPPGLGTLEIEARANTVMTERAAKAKEEAEWAAERSEGAETEAAAEAMAMVEAEARSKLAEAEARRQEADARLFGDLPESWPIIWERARKRAASVTPAMQATEYTPQPTVFNLDLKKINKQS